MLRMINTFLSGIGKVKLMAIGMREKKPGNRVLEIYLEVNNFKNWYVELSVCHSLK